MNSNKIKSALRGHSAVVSAAVLAAVAISTPVMAQDVDASSEASDADIIIVTGSRIARPNETSPIPVTAITNAEIVSTGKLSVGDQLNDLPSLRTSFSQTQNTSQLGTTGLNLLDLRGMGSERTLVLVNGRRHVPADILVNGVSVDINTISADLIERVDIITGGNSAVYGSDAIAGAVNFVLKNNFEGITAKAQGGISQHGDVGNYRFSLTAGKNFADGRGNVAFSAEYAKQNPFYASQRESGRRPSGLIQVDSDPAGTPNGSDGNPDRLIYDDIHSATLALGGLTNFGTGQCGKGSNGTNFDCTFLFQPDGTLIPQTGQRVGFGPNGSFIGGNGSTNREGKLLGLMTQSERYGFNLLAHYEFSPAATAFLEAKYYHTNTLSTGSGPAFMQGTTLSVFGGDSREKPRLDNPYLTPQAKALITQQMTIVANNNGTALPTDASRFNLRINLVDLGLRQEYAKRDTFRIVGGLRGDISDHLKYEVSLNYGHFKESTTVLGNVNVQRLLLALDATRDSNNKIVCRSQIDPAARIALAGNSAAASRLAGDVSACQPVNLFGSGNVSDPARNYIVQDTVSNASISQVVAQAFVTGDTGGFFSLPGGPIRFALGAEHRSETNYFEEDPLLLDAMTFYNSIATFKAPAWKVTELFGELNFPLLSDRPLVHDLSISGAGRMTHHSGAAAGAGTTWTYNLNGEYAPVDGLRFRGGYSKALRSPTLADLYSEQSQNFAGSFSDPCSARNIGSGTEYRAANCAADGRPAAYDYVYTSSLGYKTGGNPNLKPEISNSWTVGAVATPRMIPGLALSVDYYNIKLKNGITTLGGQTIVDQCYDSPTLANVFCSQFQRNRTSATLATGEEPYRILEGSLLSSGLNFSKREVSGLDVDLFYSHRFNELKFDTHFVYTHVFRNQSFTNAADPDRGDTSLGEVGDPYDAFNWSFGFEVSKWRLDYQLRFIGKQAITGNAIENLTTYQGRPPQDEDYSSPAYFPSVWYSNIKVSYNVNDHYNLYFGVDNLFNRDVPYNFTGSGGSTSGAAARIYDNRGRFFYGGVVAKF